MAQEPVRLYAAGSLRSVMLELGAAFERVGRHQARARVRRHQACCAERRIEQGEPVDVFASADMGHPQRLAAAGRSLRSSRSREPAVRSYASPRIRGRRPSRSWIGCSIPR